MPKSTKRSLFTPEQRDHLKRVRAGQASGPPPKPMQPRPEPPRYEPRPRIRRGGRRGCPAIDLTGQTFGRWTVLGLTGRRLIKGKPIGMSLWKCRCACGKVKDEVLYGSLTKGVSKSCGCARGEQLGTRKTTHGLSHKREYTIWQSMKTRCFNSNHHTYWRYGGKGITVCERWCEFFEYFMDDMGPCPPDKFSINRIDGRGNYEPGNCVWATAKEQTLNRLGGTTQLDLTGLRFGRITVQGKRRCSGHQTIWNCACDCGEQVAIKHSMLTTGKARSCGCHKGEPRKHHCPDFHDFTVKRPDVAARQKKKKVALHL